MRRRGPGELLLAGWGLGYIAVGIIIATAITWPIYQTPRLFVIAAAAFVLGAVVVLVPRRFGWPGWSTALVALVVYLIIVVPLAIPSALASPVLLVRGIRDGVLGIVIGWKQLLTLTLPVGEYQAVLVPFLVVVFLGTVLATTLVVSAGRWSPLAAALVIAMSVFGVVFGSSSSGASLALGPLLVPDPLEVLLGVILVLVSLAWLSGRARITRSIALRAARAQTGGVRQRAESFGFALRRNVLAVVLLVVALVAGVAVAPVAASVGPRQALRDRIDPVLVLRQQTSPLSGYRAWFDSSEYKSDLFTVTGDTKGVDRIRLATLDTYDGEDFHVGGAEDGETGRFDRLPRTTPDGGSAVKLTITIGKAGGGIWVPVPDGLAAAPTFTGTRAGTLADAFYVGDSDSSAIDVAQDAGGTYGLQPGDSYTVYAEPVMTTSAALGTGSAGAPLISAKDYPALSAWVQAQKVPRTADGLATLIKRLRARGYLSHALTDGAESKDWIAALTKQTPYSFQASYSGHSAARIESLFTTMLDQQKRAGSAATDAQLVSAVGDDEQFATASALLARYFGFDSRVVIGTRLATTETDLGVPTCSSACTGSTVSAWIEVSKPGGSWVTFDSTPQFTKKPIAITQGIELPKNPTVPDRVHGDVISPPKSASDNANALNTQKQSPVSWLIALLPALRVTGLSVLLVLLLLLPALVIAFAKRSRQRRRRDARVPEVSIVGAWDELVDDYIDHGMPVPRDATRLQLAEAVGRPAALRLAVAVNRAVFAEHPPGRDASAESWNIVESEQRELAESSTFMQRMRSRLNPASFLRQLDPGSLLARMRRRGSV